MTLSVECGGKQGDGGRYRPEACTFCGLWVCGCDPETGEILQRFDVWVDEVTQQPKQLPLWETT